MSKPNKTFGAFRAKNPRFTVDERIAMNHARDMRDPAKARQHEIMQAVSAGTMTVDEAVAAMNETMK